MEQKEPSRDEKARQELKQKLYNEAKQKIDEILKQIGEVASKTPTEYKPYLGMDIINEALDLFECKTIVVHQPQIVPLSDEEKKKKAEQKEQQEKMMKQFEQDAKARENLPQSEQPKTVESDNKVIDAEFVDKPAE